MFTDETAPGAEIFMVPAGTNKHLNCTSSPAGAIFQWYKSSQVIVTATSSEYTIVGATPGDTAIYTCTFKSASAATVTTAGRHQIVVLSECGAL